MRSLTRALSRGGALREPLPVVFPMLPNPRRGQVVMIAATSGSGKTYLAGKWIQKMGLPTLFFSADTDEETMAERMSCILTGETQRTVRDDLLAGGSDYYEDKIERGTDHIKWVFETDPTYADLDLEVCAFAETHGGFPEVICIDNLMNVVPETENENMSYRDHTRYIKRLGRVTGATIFVLHHMKEEVKDSTYPAPKNAIQGKVSQLPEMILSLASNGDEMRAATVKDRSGPCDPTGQTYQTILVDLERGMFFQNRQAKQVGHAL